jgi:YD repeat-containing protein
MSCLRILRSYASVFRCPANAEGGRRVAVLAAGLAVMISGSGAVAQQAGGNVNTANNRSTVEQSLVYAAASSFSAAQLIESACALSGGREPSCWSANGTPLAMRTALDNIVRGVLRETGVPVDPGAGAVQPLDFDPPRFSVTATDMVVPAGDVALVVQRTLGNANGMLGKNWRLNWEDRIARTASGYLITEAGGRIEFASSGSDFVGPGGEHINVTPRAGPVRVRGDRSADGYDSQGRLAWRNFMTGEDFKLQYDQAGRLVRIEGPNGAFLALAFDNAGHVTQINGSTDETVHYEYSGDDLVGVETPSAPKVHYAYESGRPLRVDHPALGATSFSYDARGRLTRTTTRQALRDGPTPGARRQAGLRVRMVAGSPALSRTLAASKSNSTARTGPLLSPIQTAWSRG